MLKKTLILYQRPALLAFVYLFSASSTSIFFSIKDDIFINGKVFEFHDLKLVAYPLIYNISTLTDFIILNPLVIFFLRKTIIAIDSVNKNLKRSYYVSKYHRIWIFILSSAVGIVIMKLYIESNLVEKHFDSNFFPDLLGKAYITTTGYVVFFWTGLFIVFLIYHIFIYSGFVIYLLSLKSNDIEYSPFHGDGVGGVNFLIKPSIYFVNAMMSALFIFVLFLIQDYLIDKSSENLRFIGFVIYILLWLPLFFIPLLHVHNLMVDKKYIYLEHITSLAGNVIKDKSILKGYFLQKTSDDEKEFILALERLEKYKNVVANFPMWPLTKSSTIPSLGSIIGASIPLLIKIITFLNSTLVKLPQ
jgi:hypothetical protein